jgi:hypothetical protein
LRFNLTKLDGYSNFESGFIARSILCFTINDRVYSVPDKDYYPKSSKQEHLVEALLEVFWLFADHALHNFTAGRPAAVLAEDDRVAAPSFLGFAVANEDYGAFR